MKIPNQQYYKDLLLDQIQDLLWVVDIDLRLVYANRAYMELMKQVTGVEKKLNESVFEEAFGKEYIDKWEAYYKRAFTGEAFEIQEYFYNNQNDTIQYGQVVFKPKVGDDGKVYSVSCQSRDISEAVQSVRSTQLIDASLDTFCTINADGEFVFVSAAAKEHWGYSPEELVGKAYESLIVEEDILKTREIAEAIVGGAEIRTFENRYIKKDESIAYNLWSARWDDEAKLMYCVARDGKEKIDKDAQLALSEQRFKSLVQEGSDLIGILDEEGNYKYVSPTSTSILGITPEEFVGRNAFEFIHPDDEKHVLESLQKVATEKKVSIPPFRFQNKNKEWRWIETVLTNMVENPAVLGIVSNSRDITEKIEEEQKLQLFEKVLDSTIDSIIITEAEPLDEPGPKIVYVNQAFLDLTGYTTDEVIGKNPRILQGPDSNQKELAVLGEKLRNWESAEITVLNYKKSGEPFWVNFAVSPVANKDGCYTHWISVQREVTDQKNRELEKDLFSQISLSFSEEESLQDAAEKMCQSISRFGKFDIIELWCPNLEQNLLHLTGCYIHNAENKQLEARRDNFNKGEGLPGKVWKEQKGILWGEQQIRKSFTRKNVVLELGLKSALGVPLFYKNEIVGVFIIGSKRDKSYLKSYSDVFNKVEGFVASEINRKSLEHDLKFLYNAIPEIICITDFNGRFKKINTAGAKMLGYSEEEVLHRSFDEFIHAEDKDSTLKEVEQLAKGSNVVGFENRYVTKKGKVIWLSWSCTSDTATGLIYATGKDITEQKNSLELNERVSKLAKIGSWEVDLEKSTIYWSDMVHEMHGTNPDEYVPDLASAINFYREDFRPVVQRGIQNCIETGEDFNIKAVIITQSLKEKWVHAHGGIEKLNGKPYRLYGSFQDITETKESEIRLESLANNLPGVAFQYVLNPDGTDALMHVTKGALKTWGFDAEQVTANNNLVWDQIELGGDLDEVKASILEAINSKNTWKARWRYVMPNKEVAVHAGYGTPMFLADGRVVFHSVILDVTAQAKNDLLLKQVSKLAKIGAWELNLQSMKPYFSDQTFQIYELPIGSPPELEEGIKFYDKEAQPIIIAAVEEAIKNHKSYDLELPFTTAKGNKIWVKTSGNVEVIDGEAVRLYGAIQDITDRKVAEKERNSLQTTLESSLNEIYIFDAKTLKFKYVNKGALSNLGYSEQEIKALTPIDLKPQFTPDSFKELITPLMKEEREKIIFFTDQQRKDRSIYPAEIHLQLVNEGNNQRFLAIGIDITARKKAEEELTATTERLRLATNAAKVGVWDWDIVQNKLVWDDIMYDIFNVNPSEFNGAYEAWEAVVHPEDIDQANKDVENAIKGISEFDSDFRIIWKDKSIRYIKGNALVTRDVNGNAIRMIGTNRDITQEKITEKIILQANERFEKVTEATNDIIWDWDIVNQQFYCSKAIDRFLGEGTAKSAKIEDVWKHFVQEEEAVAVKESLYSALNDINCTNWESEFRLFTDDEKIIYIIDRARIIRNDEGQAIRMVGAKTDITNQKELELKLKEINKELQKHALELERSNQELEQFAFITSHDLQEPLRMISSFMGLLEKNYGDQLDSKAHQYIHFATDGATRMKQIILDLLLYSRANKPTQEMEEVDLNETLAHFQQLRKKTIGEKSVVIHSDQLPTLKIQKAPITQVFHGLLDNAIKYSKAGVSPVIEIEVKEKKEQWEFSIKDNGIGIDEEFYEKIFGIFQRLHHRNEYEGTGIGLAIVKRSIEFLGGTIWLESVIGEGTTFYFTIAKEQNNN